MMLPVSTSKIVLAGMLAVLFLGGNAITSTSTLHEEGPSGTINWEKGEIVMVYPSKTTMGSFKKEPHDISSALQKLKADYLKLIQSLRINNTTTVGELLEEDPNLKEECLDSFYLAHIQKMTLLSPGKPAIKLVIPLYGETGISRLFFYKLMPPTDAPIHTVLRSCLSHPSVPYRLGIAPTGLIVDARGLQAYPCLAPDLCTPSGNLLYSLSSPQFLHTLSFGTVAYHESLDNALKDPRIGENPLVVKATSVSTVFRGNLYVSLADAIRIQEATRQTGFLETGHVIIVL